VPGTQSTAAETNERDTLICYNALTTQFVAVWTERPASPREPARARPAKKGSGNQRTRKALLITYELAKLWMKSSAKLRKEMETGKQSGVAFPAGPCRVGEAQPQKHTKTKQKCYIMLQKKLFFVFSSFEASSTEALCRSARC
jgi:hypothetical protein